MTEGAGSTPAPIGYWGQGNMRASPILALLSSGEETMLDNPKNRNSFGMVLGLCALALYFLVSS